VIKIEKISKTHDSIAQESLFMNLCQQLRCTSTSPSDSLSESLLEESFKLSLDFQSSWNSAEGQALLASSILHFLSFFLVGLASFSGFLIPSFLF